MTLPSVSRNLSKLYRIGPRQRYRTLRDTLADAVSEPDSDLRVQIHTDPRAYNIWAILDPTRRSSKRQKDLADIARLLEMHPALRAQVAEEILTRLF